jgi:hypothetical protein
MIRKLAWVCILGIIPIVGCLESRSQVGDSKAQSVAKLPINTCAGMIEYLQKLNLPALKFAEIWENDYGPGLKITTEHYEVYTTLLEPLMLSELPGFVESAYRGYNDQLSQPIETTTKFNIYLFAERKQWEDFTKKFAGPQASLYCKIKAGAYYLNGSCVVYNIGRERTFSVLGHEGWHQFNSRHFTFRLPSWLDEGCAMLFEANRYDKGLFYFEPGRNLSRLAELKKTLMTNKMIPLKQLIGMNPGEALMEDQDAATMAFYGQCYALVRFLREDSYGKRLGNYYKLMMDGLKGNWPLDEKGKRIAADRNIPITVWWNRAVGTELFKYYISPDFEQTEREYVTFCRKIVYRVQLKE